MERSLILNKETGITSENIGQFIPSKKENINGLVIEPFKLSSNNRVSEEIAGADNFQYGCVITWLLDNSKYYLFYGSKTKLGHPIHVTIGKEINGTLFLVSESFSSINNSNNTTSPFTRRTFISIAPQDIYCRNLQVYDITEYKFNLLEKKDKEDKKMIASIISTTAFAFRFYYEAKQEILKEMNLKNKMEKFNSEPQREKGEIVCRKI